MTTLAKINPAELEGVTLTAVSLEIPSGMRFNDWRRLGEQLDAAFNANLWWRADWAARGDAAFRREYPQALEEMYARQSLHNLASVARRVEVSRRRESLSFSHHEAVAALDPEWQDVWLDDAFTHGWSVHELRERIARWKGREASAAPRLTISAVGELHDLCVRAAERAGVPADQWAAHVLEQAARAVLDT